MDYHGIILFLVKAVTQLAEIVEDHEKRIEDLAKIITVSKKTVLDILENENKFLESE